MLSVLAASTTVDGEGSIATAVVRRSAVVLVEENLMVVSVALFCCLLA